MEKNVKISILLDIYGNLLTNKQKVMLDDYYNNDLSLSEIAENENITRQAVRDNLIKGENNLLEYEKKLNIMKKNLDREKIVQDVLNDIETLKKDFDSQKIKKIKKNLNSLI